jgi:hypothetical protein
MRLLVVVSLNLMIALSTAAFAAATDIWLHQDGRDVFPIGFYELPKDDAGLKTMADSGVNLVRAHSIEDLDRVAAVGMQAWIPLPLQKGATDALRQQIETLRDHPAVAVWEGPDEVIWNFTAYSGLEKIAGVTREDWWNQRPNAVAYAKEKADVIIPNLRAGIQLIRELDHKQRPVWFNEAVNSDVGYVRGYLDLIDLVGCDIYPVRDSGASDLARMGYATDRWMQIAHGKPVWMVLQGFNWANIQESDRVNEYPAFYESRHMAYNSIAHGARAILYWGSAYLDLEPFRTSLYAVTSELGALQPFLIAPNVTGTALEVIEMKERPAVGVSHFVRQSGDDWIVVLVNEDDFAHMAVEVHGLDTLNGRELFDLYADESVTVDDGALFTRMPPYRVKVFATSRAFESDNRQGRDFVPPSE